VSVGLYMDVHVPAAITRGLVLRGVDVMTAQLDGTTQLDDSDLLDRATELGRVLFSQDEDLLAEATKRQRSGQPFGGVIYAHQLGITIGRAVNDLEILTEVGTPEDFANRVEFLPLWAAIAGTSSSRLRRGRMAARASVDLGRTGIFLPINPPARRTFQPAFTAGAQGRVTDDVADICRHSTFRSGGEVCRRPKTVNMRLTFGNIGSSAVLATVASDGGLLVRNNQPPKGMQPS